jgi:type 1 glutamine amidotransferase
MSVLRSPRLGWFLAVSFVLVLSGYSLLFSQANPPAAPKKGPANANQSQIGFRPGARANRKHVLAWADVRNGSQHESIWHALATIEKLGHDSGIFDTVFRTDSQVITKDNMMQSGPDATPGRGLVNLSAFDAIFFYGAAGVDLTPAQKADLLSFVKEDGKGFLAIHTSELAFPSWPEFGDLIGGRYDEHPWTMEAPVIVEDRNFPAMKHFPPTFNLREEFYQTKDFSRDKIHVLMRLDADKVDLKRPLVHRTDKDFPLVWAKMYGKGRVFVSLLNHDIDSWDNPGLQTMYLEAIKWSMGMTDADITPRPMPASTAASK